MNSERKPDCPTSHWTMFRQMFERSLRRCDPKVPVEYIASRHYNCFLATVPEQDRQVVYKGLRRAGLVGYSHVLPDGRLQLSVFGIGRALQILNAVATHKEFAAELTRARLIELMMGNPNIEATFLMHTNNPHVNHAEKLRLGEIRIASDSVFCQGVQHHGRQQYQQAIRCYDKAIAIEPQDVRAWHNKIVALTQLGRHDQALAAADEVLARHDNVGILWEAKGQVLEHIGKLVDADKCMSRAYTLNPKIAERRASAVDQEADEWRQVLFRECRSVGKDPNSDIGFWFKKFEQSVNTNEAEKALLCLQVAARIGPDHYIITDSSGMVLLPPEHPLLAEGLLPGDAQAERIADFVTRMVRVPMAPGPNVSSETDESQEARRGWAEILRRFERSCTNVPEVLKNTSLLAESIRDEVKDVSDGSRVWQLTLDTYRECGPLHPDALLLCAITFVAVCGMDIYDMSSLSLSQQKVLRFVVDAFQAEMASLS